MGLRKIPVAFEHVCDVCGKVERSASDSRPKYWTQLDVKQDAYDWGGHAVADGSVHRLLCDACSKEIHAAINEVSKRLAPSPNEGK